MLLMRQNKLDSTRLIYSFHKSLVSEANHEGGFGDAAAAESAAGGVEERAGREESGTQGDRGDEEGDDQLTKRRKRGFGRWW